MSAAALSQTVAYLMRAHLRNLAILAGTVGLLVLFLRQANLSEVWQHIRGASPVGLALALAATGWTYVLRTWRWSALLRPLGRPRFGPTFRATVIGFAANSLLPARPGEVLRPLLLARREGLSATSALATILLERLLDLVCVLFLFGWYVWFADATGFAADPALFRTVQAGGLLACVVAVLGLGLVFAAAGHPERLGRWTRRAERVLPARLAHGLAHLVEHFAVGLAVMRRPGPLVVALGLSLPLWLSIGAAVLFVSQAFDIAISFTGTFLILAFLTVGVMLPTPGAVGGFHYAFLFGATAFFGAQREPAVAAGIVLHAISFLPVTLLGLVFMVQEGLGLSGLKHWADDASADLGHVDSEVLASNTPPAVTAPAVGEKRAKA